MLAKCKIVIIERTLEEKFTEQKVIMVSEYQESIYKNKQKHIVT